MRLPTGIVIAVVAILAFQIAIGVEAQSKPPIVHTYNEKLCQACNTTCYVKYGTENLAQRTACQDECLKQPACVHYIEPEWLPQAPVVVAPNCTVPAAVVPRPDETPFVIADVAPHSKVPVVVGVVAEEKIAPKYKPQPLAPEEAKKMSYEELVRSTYTTVSDLKDVLPVATPAPGAVPAGAAPVPADIAKTAAAVAQAARP